jgi:hypothetical protein
MSATFEFASLLGIILGYFIRFGHELWLERTWGVPVWKQNLAEECEDEEDPVEPSSDLVDERSLRERFNLPGQADAQRQLIQTPQCPEGYSAKQVLGYHDFGTPHPPQYSGGFDQWRKDHNDYWPSVDE